MGRLRLCLDVDVRSGKEHAGKYGMPALWELIDSLGREAWPQFIRADCNYGNEENMKQAEASGPAGVDRCMNEDYVGPSVT
jgi:hypothetical protein